MTWVQPKNSHNQYGQSAYSGKEVSRKEDPRNMKSPHSANRDPPDGGMQAWLVVLGAWCAMVPSMGLLNTLAVLQAWISEHQLAGQPESKVGWICSCYAFFLYFCGAQVGPVFDSCDIKWLILPGSLGMTLSIIFLSFSKEFYQILLSFGFLGGISASLLFNPSIGAIGQWFEKRRAFATSVAFTAGGLGGVGYPLIILRLSPSLGFPNALRIIAGINIGLLILACILLRKRIPNNHASRVAIDFAALKDVKYATTTVAVFLIEFAVFIPYAYICSYALHYGIPSQKAYLLNVLLNVGAIPGRVVPGVIADRLGTFNTICVTSITCGALIFGLWLTANGNETRTIVFTILFGFWSGAAISLTPVSISQIARIEDLGKRNGTSFFIASFGALVGIPIAGALLQLNGGGSYNVLIIFTGVAYFAATFAFVLARIVTGGWNIRAW